MSWLSGPLSPASHRSVASSRPIAPGQHPLPAESELGHHRTHQALLGRITVGRRFAAAEARLEPRVIAGRGHQQARVTSPG